MPIPPKGAYAWADTPHSHESGAIPQPVWTSDPKSLVWGQAHIFNAVFVRYTAVWKSPLFDLRPDLRSQTSVTKIGIPVWSRSSRLYVQFFGLEGSNNENLTMLAVEHANINIGEGGGGVGGPVAVVPATSVGTDVSSVLWGASATAPGSAILGYSPYSSGLGGGDGYPVRFWYLTLNLIKMIDVGLPHPAVLPAAPVITIQAGFY